MITVRPARPDEYAAVGALTAAGYHADDLLRLPDGRIDEDYQGLLTDAARRAETSEVLVAVDEADTLAGTVTWCPPGSVWRDLADRPDQGEFRMLSVDPNFRRRGVARSLVAACLERARAAGMAEVVLCSLVEMTSAHALYFSLGFVRAPELDYRPAAPVQLLGFRIRLVPDRP